MWHLETAFTSRFLLFSTLFRSLGFNGKLIALI
jgi:hypothetical protein